MPPSLFRRALDGSDRGVEVHAILSTVGFICLCAFQGFALWHGQNFEPSAFGQAVGFIIGGGGAEAIGQGYLLGRSHFSRPTIQRAAADEGASSRPDNPDG